MTSKNLTQFELLLLQLIQKGQDKRKILYFLLRIINRVFLWT